MYCAGESQLAVKRAGVSVGARNLSNRLGRVEKGVAVARGNDVELD